MYVEGMRNVHGMYFENLRRGKGKVIPALN
jgi:hypothetical protein